MPYQELIRVDQAAWKKSGAAKGNLQNQTNASPNWLEASNHAAETRR
jgi:hypothetical protein